MNIRQRINDWQRFLIQPVDTSSLAAFRILFGLTLGLYILTQYTPKFIETVFVQLNFFFTFSLFDFLRLKPLQEAWRYHVLFKIMGISACAFGLGILYRAALIIFFMTYGYFFLLEKAHFNNHPYLILLITFLLIFMGAHRCASIDAVWRPKIHRQQVPFWNIFILRAQICIVYFFAGLTKLNTDYLNGSALRYGLKLQAKDAMLIPYLRQDWLIYLISYGSLIFDLTIGFLLCYKPTRKAAVILAVIFHLINTRLFDIGVFPYVMLAALVLFLDPDSPRRLINKIRRIFNFSSSVITAQSKSAGDGFKPSPAGWVLSFVVIYLLIQLLVPLRHWLYPGDVLWTTEGKRFSWHLKADFVRGSNIKIWITDPQSNQTFQVDPLREMTIVQFLNMSATPDMILQYVHFLRERYKKQGIENPQIYVDAKVSLNGRPYAPLIDSSVNLAEQNSSLLSHAAWILPHPDEQMRKKIIFKNSP